MKLIPKARPVQITKLNLGGHDINSRDDLLDNFYVDEIIKLDNKFTQWLSRHEEMSKHTGEVRAILTDEKKDIHKVRGLISIFFPNIKDVNTQGLLLKWIREDKDCRLLDSLAGYVTPNISFAKILIEEFHNQGVNKEWIHNWFEKNKKSFKDNSIVKQFLDKTVFCDSEPLNDKREYRVKEYFLPIKHRNILMKLIENGKDSFYISARKIEDSDIRSLELRGSHSQIYDNWQFFINCVNNLTRYAKYTFPTKEQLILAEKKGIISCPINNNYITIQKGVIYEGKYNYFDGDSRLCDGYLFLVRNI